MYTDMHYILKPYIIATTNKHYCIRAIMIFWVLIHIQVWSMDETTTKSSLFSYQMEINQFYSTAIQKCTLKRHPKNVKIIY